MLQYDTDHFPKIFQFLRKRLMVHLINHRTVDIIFRRKPLMYHGKWMIFAIKLCGYGLPNYYIFLGNM